MTAEEPLDPILADFRNFLFVFWEFLALPVPTDVQYDIASYLQHGPKRCIIQAFRGVGKSWITSAFVCWLLLTNPQLKILVVSASKERADAFSTFTKRCISEMPLLRHLRPRDGQRDSNIAFDVSPALPAHAPSVKSVGINGQLAGSRADVIIADDVEIPSNSLTQGQRDKLSNSVKEFDAVLTPKDASRIIYLGTPQTEMTLYRQLEERGYKTCIWPARYPSEKRLIAYGERLSALITARIEANPSVQIGCSGRGDPCDPIRFNDMDLMEREGSYGRSGFAMQFMLDPSFSDSDRFPLKLSDLIVFNCDLKMAPLKLAWGSSPDLSINDLPVVGLGADRLFRPMFITKDAFAPYQGIVMAIDPAGRGGDELAYAVVAQLSGYLFVLQCKGLRGGYSDENLVKLALDAKKFGVNYVVVESNFGDGMFTKLLSPVMGKHHPCSIEEKHSSQQKEKRIIDTLEPVMNQHRLVVDTALITSDHSNYNEYPLEHAHKYQLFYQLTRITRDRGSLIKDDRADALALAVAHFGDIMDQDQQMQEKAIRQTALDNELESFMESVGLGSPSDSWLTEFGLG